MEYREDEYFVYGHSEHDPIVTDPQLPVSVKRAGERNSESLWLSRESLLDRSRDPQSHHGGDLLEVAVRDAWVVADGIGH